MKIALTYLISGGVYGQGRGVSIEAGMAFRSASIDGGEVTLWVRNDRFAMVARNVRFSRESDRIAAPH
jgi:hypothetical protein